MTMRLHPLSGYPLAHEHVITLIHQPDGRFTVDCPATSHEYGLPWFHMNIPDAAEAGRIIVSHRQTYLPGFRVAPITLGGTE